MIGNCNTEKYQINVENDRPLFFQPFELMVQKTKDLLDQTEVPSLSLSEIESPPTTEDNIMGPEIMSLNFSNFIAKNERDIRNSHNNVKKTLSAVWIDNLLNNSPRSVTKSSHIEIDKYKLSLKIFDYKRADISNSFSFWHSLNKVDLTHKDGKIR